MNASQGLAMATVNYSSLVVKDEFSTKIILEAVSQMANLGLAK